MFVLITLIFLSCWGHKLLTDFRGMSQSIQTNIPMAHFGATAPSVLRPSHSRGYQFTHNDAPQSARLLWTSYQLVAETSTWQHTTLQQTDMPLVEFEPTISAGKRPETQPIAREAIGTGTALHHGYLFCRLPSTFSPTLGIIKAPASHPGAANR